MNNTLESIKCPVCLAQFDADKYIPKIFPTCGHTVCKECLIQVLKMGTPKCPLDKLSFGKGFKSIEDFPTNFLGKDLLEMEGKWSRCQTHHELNKMICITDNTIICANCGLFGEHKGHEIKLLSDFEELVHMKKTQLSSLANKISIATSDLSISFEQKKQIIKDKVKERFSCLHAAIAKQEFQVLFQLENIFLEDKAKLDNVKFDNRTSEIKTKLSQFDNIMSNPNIITLIQEDLTELEKTVTKEISTVHSQKIEQISGLSAIFEDSLPKEDLLKDFNVIDLLDQKLLEFKKSAESPAQLPQELVMTSVPLNFSTNEGVLKVQYLRGANPPRLQRSALEQIQEVEFQLTLDESNGEDDKVLTVLIRLSKFLPNIKSVKFCFEPSVSSIHSKRILHNILAATLSQPENLEKIELTIYNQEIGDLPFIFLAEKVLPKIKDLKSLSLILRKVGVSAQLLKTLAHIDFVKIWPNLETFRFDIAGASSLNGRDFSKFLSIVPNVKNLFLGFEDTHLTDQAIEIFSTKILPFFDKLERFEATFSGTKLTSTGVDKFFMNIPNVENLLLRMGRLPITDDVVKIFLEEKLSSMVQLKEFNLEISSNHISQNVMRQIRGWKINIAVQNEVITSLSNPRVRRGPTHIRTISH